MVRVIPCLDVDEGKVVKGRRFRDLAVVGDPVELAVRYEAEGADEIVFLDISASWKGREILRDVVRSVAREISIPITVGGGIRSLADADHIFRSGADKVSINTYAVKNPGLITDISRKYGSQSTVVAIDAKKSGELYEVMIYGGREPTGLNAVEWARRAVDLGAGEILLTSIDADGTRAGYDLNLIGIIAGSVEVPIIASGGAGSPEDMYRAIAAGADAVLAASIFHYRRYTVYDVKRYLYSRSVAVRL